MFHWEPERRPPRGTREAFQAARSSRQTICSTWRWVGPVTTAMARGRVASHQRMARAAAQSLPEPFAPTTLTRALDGEGAEDLALLLVGGRVAQDVFDEADGVVPVCVEYGGHVLFHL